MQTQIQYQLDADRIYLQWFGPRKLWLGIFGNDDKSTSHWYWDEEAQDIWRQHLEHLLKDPVAV